VSTATSPLSRAESRQLLKGSHERNARAASRTIALQRRPIHASAGRRGIGGFGRISKDSRHHEVITLLQEPIAERQFSDSLMAFRDLNQESSRQIPGYSEFLNTPLDGDLFAKDFSKCRRLLLLFKKNIL
jgi:hypothetical protein